MDDDKYDEYGFRLTPPERKTKPKNPDRVAQETKKNKKTVYTILAICFLVGMIIASLLSGYIAWNCYANNLKNIRIFKTILAMMFSYLYLPYFFLLRVVLQQPCF